MKDQEKTETQFDATSIPTTPVNQQPNSHPHLQKSLPLNRHHQPHHQRIAPGPHYDFADVPAYDSVQKSQTQTQA